MKKQQRRVGTGLIVGVVLIIVAIAVVLFIKFEPLKKGEMIGGVEDIFPADLGGQAVVSGKYSEPADGDRIVHYRDDVHEFYVELQRDQDGGQYWAVPFLAAQFIPVGSDLVNGKGCRIPEDGSISLFPKKVQAVDVTFCVTHERANENDQYPTTYYSTPVKDGYLVLSNRGEWRKCDSYTTPEACDAHNDERYRSSMEVFERILKSIQTFEDYKNG